MKKNSLKESVQLVLLPAIIIAVAIFSFVLGLHPAVQCITILVTLGAIEVTGEKPTRGLLNSLVVSATAYAWALILWKAGPQTNPWGITGWAISLSVFTLICVGTLRQKKASEDTLEEILYNAVLVGCVSGIYLLFLTQYIWVILGMVACLIFASEQTRDELEPWKVGLALVSIGTISTIIQFLKPIGNFFTEMFSGFWGLMGVETLPGMPLWVLLLTIACGAGIIFVGFKETKRIEKKKKEKEKKEQEEKEEQERKESTEKKRLELTLKLSQLTNQETISWDEISPIIYCPGIPIPQKVVAKIDFASVVKYSEVKKQIGFDRYQLTKALQCAEEILGGFNDVLIKDVVENLESLGAFNGYKGYRKLYQQIYNAREYSPHGLIKKLVYLPEPKEEEN